MSLTDFQRQRKLGRLHRLHEELVIEAGNRLLTPTDRMHLARAADALRFAIEAMEGGR